MCHKHCTDYMELIKKIRKELGFTQDDAGDGTGTSKFSVGRYENGKACVPAFYLEKLIRLKREKLNGN